MSNELLTTVIMMGVIWTIALFTAWEFYKTKDGILRQLMIVYFIAVSIIYFLSSLYFTLTELGLISITILHFRLFILIPKALIMLRLLYYLKTKK